LVLVFVAIFWREDYRGGRNAVTHDCRSNTINCTLSKFGQDQVDAPPARPLFPDLAAQGLVITNTGGVIALKLTC
jgi:hypothetical protein